MRQISKVRQQKFAVQGGCCFYCKQPMWEYEPHQFAERFAVHGRRLSWLQSTAEHLTPRCDGGRDTEVNIVAACRFSNTHRHHARVLCRMEALMRSGLWSGEDQSSGAPTAGQFIKKMQSGFDGEAYDEGYGEYARDRMS